MSASRFNLPRRVIFSLIAAVIILVLLMWIYALLLPDPAASAPTHPAPLATAETTAEPETRAFMFTSNRDGDWDLYEMSLADTSVTNLTNNDSADGMGSYSGDGGAISFLSSRSGQLEAFNMNADGSDQFQVANDLRTIMSILTSGRLNWDFHPNALSQTAFVSLRDLNLEIYLKDGDTETNLTRNGAIDWFPAWSADGTRLAFGSERTGNQEVFVMDADGANVTQLSGDDPAYDVLPVWTTDGRILFVSEREVAFAGAEIGLYLVNPADPQPVRVAASEVLTIAPELNGDTALYMSNADGDWDIYRRDGATVINLTDNDTDDLFPTWKPSS